jgi:hypothetical protein
MTRQHAHMTLGCNDGECPPRTDHDLLPRRQIYPPARDYFDALKAGRLKVLKFKNPPRPRRAGGRGGLGTGTVAMIPSHTMAYAPLRKRCASPGAIADRRSRRRALELLAGCGPEGCTEAVMLANGIDLVWCRSLSKGSPLRRRSVHALAGKCWKSPRSASRTREERRSA